MELHRRASGMWPKVHVRLVSGIQASCFPALESSFPLVNFCCLSAYSKIFPLKQVNIYNVVNRYTMPFS